MRNAHEAFRASMKMMQSVLDKDPPGDKSDFFSMWKVFQKALKVHADMEDNDIFPLLDTVGDGQLISAANLVEAHETDQTLMKAVNVLISNPDITLAEVKETWMAWKNHHEAHFQAEEKVMMPLTVKIANTPLDRAVIFHEKIICPAIWRDEEGFEFLITYCTEMLSNYGSSNQSAEIATKVFLRGLRSCCNTEQWVKFMPQLRDACVPDIWSMLDDNFNIEEPDCAHLPPTVSRTVSEVPSMNNIPLVKKKKNENQPCCSCMIS